MKSFVQFCGASKFWCISFVEKWFILQGYSIAGQNICFYNIPRACLLNRSPVPAMVLKSNRSGLWRHMLETCRRLRWLCRKHSNNVARHDKTPVKSTLLSCDMTKLQLSQHFCRATWVSCCVGVTLCCDSHTFRSCNTCTFILTTFTMLRHTT